MRKNYLWYQFFRHVVVGLGLRIFYNRYKASGKENIPKNKPVLYVPNHQNSFMDALLVVCKTKPFMHFLTRAQAFHPPLLGWLLRTFNMLPIYRVRDGFSSIQKNNAIFQKCFNYLKNGDDVLVFAEANHNLKRRIRPLSKGFTRIAFGAEEENNWNLDLQIIPVGINYSKHRESRNPVHIVFGKPIPVKQFEDEFKKDENAASQHLKELTETEMKELVMHIPNLEDYSFYKIILDDLETNRNNVADPKLMNDRIERLQTEITEELSHKAKTVDTLAEKFDVEIADAAYGKKITFWDIILFPLYLFTFLNNIIQYQAVRYLTTNVIKDHAFDISIKFLTGLFLLPLFYLIVSGILALLGVSGIFILCYFLLSLFSAPLFIKAKKLILPDSAKRLKRSKPEIYRRLTSEIQIFTDIRKSILNE